ncbi:hypothetical protein GW17_00001725 [Ensete ventricosum]|nr:hypothetical protein GW17_00001725 [Ensete ventricosum]
MRCSYPRLWQSPLHRRSIVSCAGNRLCDTAFTRIIAYAGATSTSAEVVTHAAGGLPVGIVPASTSFIGKRPMGRWSLLALPLPTGSLPIGTVPTDVAFAGKQLLRNPCVQADSTQLAVASTSSATRCVLGHADFDQTESIK